MSRPLISMSRSITKTVSVGLADASDTLVVLCGMLLPCIDEHKDAKRESGNYAVEDAPKERVRDELISKEVALFAGTLQINVQASLLPTTSWMCFVLSFSKCIRSCPHMFIDSSRWSIGLHRLP